jgi:predicted house-cleaning noncanonical NTP pyrophosphatase (MazG superfamily)
MALTPAPNGYPLKIIRDKTTDIIGDSGQLLYGYVSTDPETLRPWLLKKLAEELLEYTLEPGEGELADIFAVVQGLAKLHGLTTGALWDLAARDPRGGFGLGELGYYITRAVDEGRVKIEVVNG